MTCTLHDHTHIGHFQDLATHALRLHSLPTNEQIGSEMQMNCGDSAIISSGEGSVYGRRVVVILVVTDEEGQNLWKKLLLADILLEELEPERQEKGSH